jgi:hypothetical protein
VVDQVVELREAGETHGEVAPDPGGVWGLAQEADGLAVDRGQSVLPQHP